MINVPEKLEIFAKAFMSPNMFRLDSTYQPIVLKASLLLRYTQKWSLFSR